MSIVVPHLGDDSRFESSLVSVLENRPRRCEVLVCHDGSYGDPFDLGDEVRFVTSPSQDLPSQVLAAAEAAQGRLLHVLCDGAVATEGWTEAALDAFEDPSVASVAPRVSDGDDKHTAALGWTQTAGSVCTPVAAGRRTPSRRDRAAVRGAYLSASFWRTAVLRCLDELTATTDPHVATALWTAAIHRAGLRCSGQVASQVRADSDFAQSLQLSATTTRHLQSVATVADGQSALKAGLTGLAANVHRPGRWSPAWGRLSAAWADTAIQRRWRSELPSVVAAVMAAAEGDERPMTLKMPTRSRVAVPASVRRAA
ncbi:glycosyltransferase family A protein [Roseimaritima sediminicola]|uniref:glycosyltransferase family A protein n=1 Tax=Roseimaritima sediminicola TaxID=2662066 RepID=UPI00129825A2|nr:glycosyltransferase family A protein [Roseimaritima sediminicola]